MMRRLVTGGVALVLAVLIAPLPAQASPGGIHGTVTGPGGTPLAGITVNLWTNPQDNDPQTIEATTHTGADGTYSFDIGAAVFGLYVCFDTPDYASECYDNAYEDGGGFSAGQPVYPTEAGTVVNAELTLGGSFHGVVRSDQDVALPGVTVQAHLAGSSQAFTATSDSGGAYQFSHLPPGVYTVCGSAKNLMFRCTGDLGGPATYTIPDPGTDQSVSDLVFQTAPEHVRVSGTGAQVIQWSWDALGGAFGYRVAISTSPLMSNPVIKKVSNRWASFSGLKKNTLYYVVVRAYNSYSTTAGTKLAGKTGVVARPVGVHPENWDGIDWSWAPYAGAAKYLVKMRTGSSWVGAEQHVVTGTKISLGVERDSCASLKVIALNQHGQSISTWSAPGEGCVPYHPV